MKVKNMSNFINRDDLSTEIEKINCVDYGTMDSFEAHNAVRDCLYDVQILIYSIPTAEVVHCKDCKFLGVKDFATGYCKKNMCGIICPDDFCSHGKKKESAD